MSFTPSFDETGDEAKDDLLAGIPWHRLTALVLGGTGMIGRHTIDALLGRGVRVRALVRPSSRSRNLRGLPIEQVEGDLDSSAGLEAALQGCDLLFHCAAPYPRSHFHRGKQVDAAVATMRGLLTRARAFVPRELLVLPAGRLAQRAIEQAEGAAAVLRHHPDREEELRTQLRAPQWLDPARAGRLSASLHPPLADCVDLPGLKRIVYVSSLTTIGRPHGRDVTMTGQPARAPRVLADESDRYDLIQGSSPYFAMKREMEAEATRAAVEGLPIVIGNPGLCVDAWDATPTTGQLLVAIARGRMPFYLPGVMNVVATRDVGEALVNATALGRTGQRYILGTTNLEARDFLALIAREAGVPPPRIPIPLPLAAGAAWLSEVANLLARRPWPALPMSSVQMMRYSQPFDTTLARTELRMPQTPIETAVHDAMRWLHENGYF